jgi:hypothetical protein
MPEPKVPNFADKAGIIGDYSDNRRLSFWQKAVILTT